MFSISKPQDDDVARFVASQKQATFSYAEVGETRNGEWEARYKDFTVDNNRIRLGTGQDIFRSACTAVREWKMFELGWVDLFPRNAPSTAGQTVASRIHHFGFWSLNACRVVYTIEDPRRFGFAYGTLQDHAECGEERFTVEWQPDDSVRFQILAFSKPRSLARLGVPLARNLQKRFAREAMRAIQDSVRPSM
jgi:uncharacterized protein (UPF0548 family)